MVLDQHACSAPPPLQWHCCCLQLCLYSATWGRMSVGRHCFLSVVVSWCFFPVPSFWSACTLVLVIWAYVIAVDGWRDGRDCFLSAGSPTLKIWTLVSEMVTTYSFKTSNWVTTLITYKYRISNAIKQQLNFNSYFSSKSRPNNIRGGKMSVRMSVRTSVHKKFLRFQWNLVYR